MKLGLSIVLYKQTGNASKTKQSRPYLCTSNLPGLSLCAVPDRLVCLTGLSTRRTGDRGPGDSTIFNRWPQGKTVGIARWWPPDGHLWVERLWVSQRGPGSEPHSAHRNGVPARGSASPVQLKLLSTLLQQVITFWDMFPPNLGFAHPQTTHPNNIIIT